MVRIFQPTHLGCPVCNQDPNRHSAYGISAHKRLTEEQYKGHLCGHEFSLFEALRQGCNHTFGILNTFSHWQWSSEEAVVVGRLFKIPVPIPGDVNLFAAFLTPYTPSDGPQVHYIPRVLDMSGPELLISTAGSLITPSEQLGTEMRLFVGVYGFRKLESRGWARLLYESLTDYSEKNYGISVFKLATSLEIACEKTIEAYLSKKEVSSSLVQRLLRSGRNWDARMGRICDIAPTFLGVTELEALEKAAKDSLTTIRPYRNAFAHDDPSTPDYHAASEAFTTSFPIFWGIERILAGCA
ncbi:MAG: hypothetical protein ABIO96_02165 [Nitrospiraceae bacterium]